MTSVQIYIEGEKVDLFKDESINIKSRVQDVNDISKVFTDFSKSFNLPASEVNNKLFKHYYNSDITGGFDARSKKAAAIHINDILFRKGKIRLTGTKLKNNRIDSYNVQFEGDTVKIRDLLGGDKLDSLDFSDLDHVYDSDNVKQGIESSIMGGDVIYPFVSYKRRFTYSSNQVDNSTESLVNLAFNTTSLFDGAVWTEFKPAVTVGKIFEKIQDKYSLVFGGDVLNRDYVRDLYLLLNKDEGRLITTGRDTKTLIDWTSGDTDYMDLSTDTVTYVGATYTDYFEVSVFINPTTFFEEVEYQLVIENHGDVVLKSELVKGDQVFNSAFQVVTGALDLSLKFYIISTSQLAFQPSVTQAEQNLFTGVSNLAQNFNLTGQILNPLVDMSYQMPDIKILDFITGIVKMFNLTIVPDNDGVLNFITLDEWYKTGKVINVSDHIDIESTNINRGKLKNEFVLKYDKPKTFLAQKFLSNNGVGYGDVESKLFDNNGELLDGNKLEIKLPFENMVYERIADTGDGQITNIQYGFVVDKSQESVVTKPIFFYNNNIDVGNKVVAFKNVLFQLEPIFNINTPNTCLSLVDNTRQTLNFGAEFSTYNYGVMEQSLYNSFYKDYITDMFSNLRRMYKYTSYLPSEILSTLQLNDRLVIGNKRYIINSFDLNLIDGKTKFELLNDIYDAGDLIGESFLISRNAAIASINGDSISVLVTATGITDLTVIDLGNGVFTTPSTLKPDGIQAVDLVVDKNTTGVARKQTVTFKNGATTLQLDITQGKNSLDWSNNTITLDNNNITWDNN